MKTKIMSIVGALLLISMVSYAQVTTKTAMETLETAINKFKKSDGLIVDMSLKISIAPSLDMKLYTRGDKCAIEMDGGIVYYANGTSWEYDEEDNEVEIKTIGKNDMDDMAMIATMPKEFEIDFKEVDSKSFKTAKSTVKFKENGNNIEYKSEKDGATLTMNINKTTKNFSSFKVKKGIVVVTITYNSVRYSCSEAQVTFDASKHPGVKIIDKRKNKK